MNRYARWRRQRRQAIQDWLIAAVQNVKIWVRAGGKRHGAGVDGVLDRWGRAETGPMNERRPGPNAFVGSVPTRLEILQVLAQLRIRANNDNLASQVLFE